MIDDLARLKIQLQITKLSIDKPQLYQLLLQMIDGLINVTKSVDTAIATTSNNSSNSNGIITRITILTDDQTKALPTTGVEIIPACANGSRNKLLAISFYFDNLAGGYTNINASYADFHCLTGGTDFVAYGPADDPSVTPPLTKITDSLGIGQKTVYDLPIPPQDGLTGSSPQYVQNLQLYNRAGQESNPVILVMENNGSGNLTGGNIANSIKITSYYIIQKF